MAKRTVRSNRTLKATQLHISAPMRARLAELRDSPLYEALLDAMEMAVMMEDTALINRDVGDREGVLGQHAAAKAAWNFFTRVQKLVETAYIEHTGVEPEKEPLSETDQILSIY